MKKQLPVAILALVVLLCSASTVSAQVSLSVTITPDVQYASPQISQFWTIPPPPKEAVCQANKTVTYTVTVETDCPPVSVSIKPGDAPASWFSWLNEYTGFTTETWPLGITVPQTLGKDAKGTYTITVVAVDSCGVKMQDTATLIVQDYDYVTETCVQGAGIFTLNEDFNNRAVAVKVKKHIDFIGEVDSLTKNEYLLVNARGDNANYEQESTISDYRATLWGWPGQLVVDEQFKSCAVMGGTGVRVHERYEVPYDPNWTTSSIEFRCENLNHHITGDQRLKTEFTTLNNFTNGEYLLDSRQSVPCTRSTSTSEWYTGDFEIGRHIIYRRP
jgi:hypothetical protein